MKAVLITLVSALIIGAGVACGSGEEESAPVAQVADLSQFPTPTRSQAEPRLTSPPATAQPQTTDQNEAETAEVEPMTPEEMQQLRQRMQSGELSEEEMQQAIERLRAQFGGGQGGPPFGAAAGSVAVGSIESVGEGAITVKTELASVTASVGEDTDIRITSILEPAALTDGAQVVVVSERVEGGNVARVVTVVPEGQGGFGGGPGGQRGLGGGQSGFGGSQGGQGGLGGGQGGQGGVGARPLFGTLENVTDAGFTLETQRGPLPVALDDESLVVQTRQGSISDLEAGMQVGVVGVADDEGGIEARSVVVTPDGMEGVRGFGGGGRGLGGGR